MCVQNNYSIPVHVIMFFFFKRVYFLMIPLQKTYSLLPNNNNGAHLEMHCTCVIAVNMNYLSTTAAFIV